MDNDTRNKTEQFFEKRFGEILSNLEAQSAARHRSVVADFLAPLPDGWDDKTRITTIYRPQHGDTLVIIAHPDFRAKKYNRETKTWEDLK